MDSEFLIGKELFVGSLCGIDLQNADAAGLLLVYDTDHVRCVAA